MSELETLQADGEYFRDQLGSNKGFIVTYSKTTPESVEAGDCSEHGFKDYNSCEPDNFDLEDGEDAVSKAVEYLKSKGANEPSNSHFSIGTWYSTGFDTDNYQTGEQSEDSYHPKNFTPDEEKAIFDAITKR